MLVNKQTATNYCLHFVVIATVAITARIVPVSVSVQRSTVILVVVFALLAFGCHFVCISSLCNFLSVNT